MGNNAPKTVIEDYTASLARMKTGGNVRVKTRFVA